MYRRTAHRGVAALALVLMLVLVGAQPAAAADRTVLDRFASFWGAVIYTVPGAHAALNTLTGWFNKIMTDPMTGPQPTVDRGFGIDPNGNEPPPPPVGQG
jgi:hypothetical protein